MDIQTHLELIKKSCQFQGRHYSSYVDEALELKRRGLDSKLETLLIHLIEATEAEDRISRYGVAPWYYEELAKLYRRKKDYLSETMILVRYADHQLGRKPFTKTPILLKRLERAKYLLERSEIVSETDKKHKGVSHK